MTQIHRIPILIPLAVGVITFACTIFVHELHFRRERSPLLGERLGLAGASFWSDFAIVALIILFSLVAHSNGTGTGRQCF